MPDIPNQPVAGLSPTGGVPQTDPNILSAQVDQTVSANPEILARIRAGLEAGLQSGEIAQEDLNTMIQMVKAVVQNPALYPQMRALAVQRGLVNEEDLPPQYDEGLMAVLLIIVRAAEEDIQVQPQGMPQAQPQGMPQGMPQAMPMAGAQQPAMMARKGGKLPDKSKNLDGTIPLVAHEGEFVIPAHVVKKKGTEFFEKMLESYNEHQDKK